MDKLAIRRRNSTLMRVALLIITLAVAAVATLSIISSLAGAVKVTDIAVSHGTSIVLTEGGEVWTWGYEWHGVLGRTLDIHDPITDQSTPKPVPYRSGNLTGVTDIAAGLAHVVALKDDGTVMTWGYNHYGQLGDGTTTDSMSASGTVSLSQVKGLDHVKAVAAGLLYSLALKDDGTVWAWGYNRYGQLGSGEFTRFEKTPVQVEGLSGIAQIYAGYNHNVAIDGNGNAWAWGSNDLGELGDGTNVSQCTPIRIAALSGAKDVALGSSYTIALYGDGTVKAWGENYGGWLGDGTTTQKISPVAVKGVDHVNEVATGEGISFASRDDGTVMAWGMNRAGTIGNGVPDQRVYMPGKIGDMKGIMRFAVGPIHVLGIKEDGSLWGWGDNQFGEMGTGMFTDKTYTPMRISLDRPADPSQTTGQPTSAPDNATDGASAGGSSHYLQYGIIALMCLIIAAAALVWYSRR